MHLKLEWGNTAKQIQSLIKKVITPIYLMNVVPVTTYDTNGCLRHLNVKFTLSNKHYIERQLK